MVSKMFKGGLLHIRGKKASIGIRLFLRKKLTCMGAFIYPLEENLAIILESDIDVNFYRKLVEEIFRKFNIRLRIAISCEETISKVLDKAYYNLRSIEMENIVYDVHECEVEELASLFIPNYTSLSISFSKYMNIVFETFKLINRHEGIIIPYENGSYIGFIPREGINEIASFRKYLGVGVHVKPGIAVGNAISNFKGASHES